MRRQAARRGAEGAIFAGAWVLLVLLGALACDESSSNGDGSGGSGATTSSGGTAGSTAGSGADAGQSGASNGGSAGNATGGQAGMQTGGNGGRGGTGGGAGMETGGNGGQAGMGGTGGGGEGGMPPDDVVTDPPTLLTNVGDPNDLEITHSHFYIDPEAQPANTWRWLAVVRSHRSDLACELMVEADFLNSGAEPIKIFAAVAAPDYRRTTTASVFRCIPPGELGIASGAALDGVPRVMPSSVTEIQYAITGSLGPDYVPGNWVTISGVEVAAGDMGNVVRGTFTNGMSQIAWWEGNVYPMNSRGMPLIQFILRDTAVQLAPFATWNFETPAYDADFDDAYVFVRHAGAL